jgi:hypothetical protein
MIENAYVQAERKRQMQQWWDGMDEGYRNATQPLPEWYSKPYIQFTARERGYVFGRELRLHEGDDPR